MFSKMKDESWKIAEKDDSQKKDLEECDGKEGRPAYAAFKGKVYDVSSSELWANGTHGNRHKAGNDLTPNMPYAPHGEELLKKFPVVGELVEEENYRLKSIGMVERLHIHPIMVHFT
jgi:predicted heme/steroid binding protein